MNAGARYGGGPGQPGSRTRWPKGQSGNPRGRPKTKKDDDTTPVTLEMAGMIMSEYAREVTLSEGGKLITMPAGQAAARATFFSAIRGNPTAQRTALQQAASAQEAQEKRRREEYAAAISIKIRLEHERDVWVSLGRTENDMPRHPSDLEICHVSLTVRNYLLHTEEQILARRRAIALRDYLTDLVSRNLETVMEDGDDLFLETTRELAKGAIKTIEEGLPRRFRRHLPGDAVPFSLYGSPEEIWLQVVGPLVTLLTK